MRQTERLIAEGRWAVRKLRSRGWRAATIGLLAVALAANILLFATADSLIFRRMPYPDAERLLHIGFQDPATGRPTGGFDTPAGLDEWRGQADLFAGVHAVLHKVIFLTGAGDLFRHAAASATAGRRRPAVRRRVPPPRCSPGSPSPRASTRARGPRPFMRPLDRWTRATCCGWSSWKINTRGSSPTGGWRRRSSAASARSRSSSRSRGSTG